MILSMKTENILEDNLDENHELFSNKNKKVSGYFKNECPKKFWIDEIVCLRSKAYSFKCEDNIESKIKIKGISKPQSKHIKFEEYKKCLDGEKYQRKCNNCILRSINHDMYLQEIKK